MNIATIYREMESRNTLNLAVYLGYLQEHTNSSAFDFNEVLSKESKYLRALACASLSIKNPRAFFSLITGDRHMPVFTSHMVLIKCSAELLNLSNSNDDLEKLLDHTIEAVRQSRFSDPGTTLSFAFGFVLGTAIKRGINVKSFFNKLDSKFIVSNDKLFSGFTSGLNKEHLSLVSSDQYVTDISDRYDNWEDRSRILSLSIFKAIPTEEFNGVTLNEENLKVLEYFSGRSQSYNNFLKDYQNKLHTIHLQKQSEKAKQNVVEVAKNPSSLEKIDEQNDLKKTVAKQQEEISALNNQLQLYQSVFKQFETLFPDLQKTLQSSDSNKELLQKIQGLVNEQQNNVKNLQSYYEEGEKQKAIKEGIKKRL